MWLECPECQSCFSAKEWAVSYKYTQALLEAFTEEKQILPVMEEEEEIYNFLYEDGARMDCPECGEVICIEDLTIC